MSCDVEQSSFSNLFVASPKSQLFLQPFRRFTYVTAHSPTLPLLHLRHSSFNSSFASPTSFSNLSVASPTPQLFLQPFRRFTYVTAHSLILPLLHLRHSLFSNPFFRFSYATTSSLNSPGEPPMDHKGCPFFPTHWSHFNYIFINPAVSIVVI